MTEQTREAVENYLRNADKKPGESTYHDATTFTKYCKIVVKGITVIDEPAFLYQEAPASDTRCIICRTGDGQFSIGSAGVITRDGVNANNANQRFLCMTCMGLFLSSSRFGLLPFFVRSGKAVLRPVACDQVRGARGRGQGTETLAKA